MDGIDEKHMKPRSKEHLYVGDFEGESVVIDTSALRLSVLKSRFKEEGSMVAKERKEILWLTDGEMEDKLFMESLSSDEIEVEVDPSLLALIGTVVNFKIGNHATIRCLVDSVKGKTAVESEKIILMPLAGDGIITAHLYEIEKV